MTMKAAGGGRHTPGPWRKEMEEIYATIGESDYLIADASGHTAFSADESNANAELIAAAPELLRLLQVAYEVLRSFQHGNESVDLAQEIAHEIEPVLAQHAGGE